MRCLRLAGFAIAFCLLFVLFSPYISRAYEDTQCFQCHTSAKKIIEATREIAKTRPVVKSEETAGEG